MATMQSTSFGFISFNPSSALFGRYSYRPLPQPLTFPLKRPVTSVQISVRISEFTLASLTYSDSYCSLQPALTLQPVSALGRAGVRILRLSEHKGGREDGPA